MIEKIKKELEKIKEVKDKLTYLIKELDKAKDEELKEEILKLIKEIEESLEAKVEAEIEETPIRREIIPQPVEVEIEEPIVIPARSEPLEVEVAEAPESAPGQYSSGYGLSTFNYSLGFDYQEVASGTDDSFRDKVINELREEGILPHDGPLTSEVARGTIAEKVRGLFPGSSPEKQQMMVDDILYGKKEKRLGDYLINKNGK